MEKVQHGGSVAEVVGLPYMHRLPMEREVEQEVRASCTHGAASSVASRSFAADAPGQLHVLGHYGDPLRMEGAQVGVLEELNEMHLGSLLKREQRRRLKSHVLFHFLRNLANESLERRFSNEQVGRSLVPADLPHIRRPIYSTTKKTRTPVARSAQVPIKAMTSWLVFEGTRAHS